MIDKLEEGQIVQCTVEKIIGTIVFVSIDGYNEEGTITSTEISPGRIRNLREYVIPGKKIVCKILSIKNGKFYLSLRRVTQSARKELLDKISREKSVSAILKTVLGKEKSEKVIEKITKDYNLIDFFEDAKNDSSIIKEYLSKEEAEKIIKIIESKKDKNKEIRQIFNLSTKSSNGIITIKKILLDLSKKYNCTISYIAAGKYRILFKGEDFKILKAENNKFTEEIEKTSKKNNCEFSIQKS